MSQPNLPIIVGAGPVGLGAALFLALEGRATRVIESRTTPAQQSKALAINPRTLEILEASGLTSRVLELGKPMRGAKIHQDGRLVAQLAFEGIHPRYPFLVALSQASTERLLAEALQGAGGTIERGVRLAECRNRDGDVEVLLESEDRAHEAATCPWLLATDGAHSAVREQLGIGFPGSSMTHEWYLADVPLQTNLEEDYAHIYFSKEGFVFLVRVIDEALAHTPGGPVWRIITTRPDPLSRLPEGAVAGPPIWASNFHVSHRINRTLAAGHVYFAGDAGHIHSPVGARGMNLGLEDAWVFSQLVQAGRLDEYDALRKPVDQTVVRRVEFISHMVAGDSWFNRTLRSSVLPTALSIPLIRKSMMRTLMGLDHPLSRVFDGRTSHGQPTEPVLHKV